MRYYFALCRITTTYSCGIAYADPQDFIQTYPKRTPEPVVEWIITVNYADKLNWDNSWFDVHNGFKDLFSAQKELLTYIFN